MFEEKKPGEGRRGQSFPRIYADVLHGHWQFWQRAPYWGSRCSWGVHPESIGDFVRFEINAAQATSRADQVMLDHKLDPASYQHATTVTYTFDNYTNEYLRRTVGIAAANRIYRDRVPSAFWTVRYFRDSQNEEYMVVLRTDGSLHSLHHTLDERAAGANLSRQDAQSRAEEYLRDEKQFDLSSWKLVETNTEKRPVRTDHTFIWSSLHLSMPKWADSPARMFVCN